MRGIVSSLAAGALLAAGVPTSATAGSRVIASTTLNSTLQFFDADTLEELQPPLPSRGGGPVRLWVETFGGVDYLLAANHGLVGSSVGVFDLSGDVVIEAPLSPAPAPGGFGAVGIGSGMVKVSNSRTVPMVFLGNTYFALAPCNVVPPGSVTGFDASLIGAGGLLTAVGTVDIAGGLAWGVSVDGEGGKALATSNCANRIDSIAVTEGPGGLLALENVESRPTGPTAESVTRPDGTVFDDGSGLNYTVNIGASTVSVHADGVTLPATTVALPAGSGPIDTNFATSSTFGKRWLVTANGSKDTVSLVDRAIVETCVAAQQTSCPEALAATLPTNVASGAPEGVAFDPASDRIFVINKPILGPSISVIEITGVTADGSAPAGYTVQSEVKGNIPLTLAGQQAPVPAIIAFDVEVQVR